jgi:hypothetical protein
VLLSSGFFAFYARRRRGRKSLGDWYGRMSSYGELWQEQSRWESEEASFPAPFDQRFHLVLNLAIGGDFVGEPASDTPFPAQFLIDWVRVFQAHEQTDCMGGPCSI